MKTIVAELRELLGNDVLLLHCRSRKKKPAGRWKTLTIAVMDSPKYLAKLGTGNIGVVLGSRSGGLCSLDIDDDADYAAFLDLNPELRNTLRTRGARGGNIWLRMAGNYPGLTPLKLGGREWGEWRANGAQTIIWGEHPTGCNYQFIQKTKPLVFAYKDIRWPEGIVPPELEDERQNVTEKTHHTEPTEETELAEFTELTERTDADRSGVVVSLLLSPIQSFNAAVEYALPTANHENHGRLFALARAVRGLEANWSRELTEEELLEVFASWHQRSLPYLRDDQSRDDYYFEFLEGYENAMSGVGINAVDVAWMRAKDAVPPTAATKFQSKEIQQLVCLCRELGHMAHGRAFFLSCRTVQRLMRLSSPMVAYRWLEGLRRAKILEVVIKGQRAKRKATRFRYLGKE